MNVHARDAGLGGERRASPSALHLGAFGAKTGGGGKDEMGAVESYGFEGETMMESWQETRVRNLWFWQWRPEKVARKYLSWE